MTLTLEIDAKLESVLEARARRRGLALDAYILDLAQRDAIDSHDTESAANDLWMKLTNDATHNAAVIALAQAPETVRAIVVKRCADAAESFYASAAGKREADELEDWLSLDGGSFQTDKAERSSAQ